MRVDAYRQGWYEGQADMMCCLVGVGKPVGGLQVPTDLLGDVEAICEQASCLHCAEPCEGADGWSVLYIYRKPMMLDIIQRSRHFHDDSTLGVWFKGMMYGYSLADVERFVEENGLAIRSGSQPTST